MNRKRQPGWKDWHPPPPRPPSRWDRLGFTEKTAWDWLNLLIVPLGVAFFAGLFTIAQAIYQQSAEERLQQTIVDLTSRTQRALEQQRAQDATLQAYLDAMDALILKHHLRNSKADSEVRTLAQARTITTVERLDARRIG
jgi:aryl carrier-like protein